MSTSHKAIALARELADTLKKRLSTLAFSEGFDTDGAPLIIIGDGVAGDANAVIKVNTINWPLAKDVLGLNQTVFTPHVIQVATEANPAGGAGADPLSPQQLLSIWGDVLLKGTRAEWYQSTSGVAPTASTYGTPSNLKASYDNLYYPMTSSS